MSPGQKPSKPLFSQYFLERRLQELPEWQEEVATVFEQLRALYESKKLILRSLNESQTESELLQPVLEILGFAYINQVMTRGKGRAERPDYALFASDVEKMAAFPLQQDEAAFYPRVLAIAEVKYWERPLSKVSRNDGRDIFKNENPSFQIVNYLTGTGVDWGILTNGREWRLYYRQASSKAKEFYDVDVLALLESGDLEQFKYFWLFFRKDAFLPDAQGKNFLERVREGSTTYATQVEEQLKKLVFEQIFPNLAGGFVSHAQRQGQNLDAGEVYSATLSFLYKVLFLLYAEAKSLLPIEGDYRDYSLISMAQKIRERLDRASALSETMTGWYDHLLGLFHIIDRGDANLQVPRYNGGLFHFDFAREANRQDYPENWFLQQYKITDAVLAPALDKLARIDGEPVDYSFLGVRQLGSIYEGLLEYRLVIDDAADGKTHLENDKGERKATGSYYTPDYIVKYIVKHTLMPILAERKEQFQAVMAKISEIRLQMQDKRLGSQSLRGLQRELKGLEQQAIIILLDIRICDPAMGSGHFLVEAVDFLTDEIASILTEFADNPVLAMLEEIRGEIVSNLARQRISINGERLKDEDLLHRVVMKRCIYGVDLNKMAVELAKVSLWLHSFTVGAPLSFLDHHLRWGNSLIGTTAREAEAAMQQEESGQLLLLTGPFAGLLQAAEIMRGISTLSDATFAEVEQSERLFRDFDAAAKPYKQLLDIYVAQYFGVKRAENVLRVYGAKAINAKTSQMSKKDAAVFKEAEKLRQEKRFFHWDLEFPEVFIDLETANWKENPGFDAVVGNPPWGGAFSAKDKNYLQFYCQLNNSSSVDSYAVFTKLAILRISKKARFGYIIPDTFLRKDDLEYLRSFLLSETELEEFIETGPLFKEVRDTWCLVILGTHKNPSNFHRIKHRQISRFIVSAEERLELFAREDWSRNSQTAQLYWKSKPKLIVGYRCSRKEQLTLKAIENKTEALKNHHLDFLISRGEEGSKFNLKHNQDSDFRIILPELVERYWIGEGEKIDLETLTSNKIRKYYSHPKIWLIRIQKLRWLQRIVSACDLRKNSAGIKTLQIIISKSDDIQNLLFLSTLLSSKVINYWCENYLVDDMNQSYLEKLPIRKINFSTQPENRQRHVQHLISLYNQFQSDTNCEPILQQVAHHLNQEPEEADVIHDLLAHLAEQMIEMNQQKQAEIKSFLKWLGREIGCEIDNLTNKTKIKNYLGDYQKGRYLLASLKNEGGVSQEDRNLGREPHLSLEDLLKLLKQNHKKLTCDPSGRKFQETLETEYQASLDKLLPLKNKLMRCDRLIDEIVYKLYGLTAEEIGIVEGKNG